MIENKNIKQKISKSLIAILVTSVISIVSYHFSVSGKSILYYKIFMGMGCVSIIFFIRFYYQLEKVYKETFGKKTIVEFFLNGFVYLLPITLIYDVYLLVYSKLKADKKQRRKKLFLFTVSVQILSLVYAFTLYQPLNKNVYGLLNVESSITDPLLTSLQFNTSPSIIYIIQASKSALESFKLKELINKGKCEVLDKPELYTAIKTDYKKDSFPNRSTKVILDVAVFAQRIFSCKELDKSSARLQKNVAAAYRLSKSTLVLTESLQNTAAIKKYYPYFSLLNFPESFLLALVTDEITYKFYDTVAEKMPGILNPAIKKMIKNDPGNRRIKTFGEHLKRYKILMAKNVLSPRNILIE